MSWPEAGAVTRAGELASDALMPAAAGLTAEAYLTGAAAAAAVMVALVSGGRRMRRALLPEWRGMPARLAESVIVLLALIVPSQILGSVGLFRPLPVLLVEVAIGVTMVAAGSASGLEDSGPRHNSRRSELAAALATMALIAVQWTSHTADALTRGMTHPDTLWYHAPFSIRFLQRGSFSGLEGLGYGSARYFPFNSELLHALAVMPFHRDVLSPLVNLGWAALTLVAAWCIGQRRNVGPMSVIGAVIVLGLPTVTGTQPGQASNDIMCGALMLSALALLLEGELEVVPTALAGAAGGLALGTKLTLIIPMVALTIGVVGLALRARRPRAAIAWCASLVVCGGYWFARNWAVVGSPVPWLSFHLGPFSLAARVSGGANQLVRTLAHGAAWRDLYLPGLHQALGIAWPVIFTMVLAGAAAATIRGRGVQRLAGAVVLVGLVGHIFTPLSGGLFFKFDLRYVVPVLLIGFTFLPLLVAHARPVYRSSLALAMVVLVGFNALAPNHERVAAWPASRVLPALVAVAAMGGAVALLRLARKRGGTAPHMIAATTIVLAVLVVGWPVQDRYFEHRYLHDGLFSDAVDRYFRDVRGTSVAAYDTTEVYQLFGPDLSNYVTNGQTPEPAPTVTLCEQWRQFLSGRYRYVVFGPAGLAFGGKPPDEVFATTAASKVVRSDQGRVYLLDRSLPPSACRPAGPDR